MALTKGPADLDACHVHRVTSRWGSFDTGGLVCIYQTVAVLAVPTQRTEVIEVRPAIPPNPPFLVGRPTCLEMETE